MTLWLAHPRVHHLSEVNSGLVLSRWTATKDDIPWFCFGVAAQLQPRLVSGDVAGVGCLRVRGLLLRRPLRSTLRESGGSVAVYCSVGGWVGSLKPSEFVGAGTRPVKTSHGGDESNGRSLRVDARRLSSLSTTFETCPVSGGQNISGLAGGRWPLSSRSY